MTTILQRILEDKRGEVRDRRRQLPLEELIHACGEAPKTRGFATALRHGVADFRIIAEVKKASPSKGLIREDFDPVEIARSYERGGAAAISVLTDAKYFQGHLDFLRAIRDATSVPLLRKDFIIDPYQVYEARACGADAILLIMAATDDDGQLRDLAQLAAGLDLDVLWEVHDEDELARVLRLEPSVIGVNNRNLGTFEVRLETSRDLMPQMPVGVVKVSESGFFDREELERMSAWGVDAFLIGESLMRQEDPGAALTQLTGIKR